MTHPAITALRERFPRGWVEPKDVAEEVDVHYQTVLGWIHSGELPALGVGRGGSGPYRIYLTQLNDFMVNRSSRTPAPAAAAEPAPEQTAEAATARRSSPPSGRRRPNTGLVAA